MILYRVLSSTCSACLIVKEMTRRVLADYPEITAEDVDMDLEPERAKSLILPQDLEYEDVVPIPYLRIGSLGLKDATKFQQIRDFLNTALAQKGN